MSEEVKYVHLDSDDPVPRQNYVCVSFAEPQGKTIENRLLFGFAHYLLGLLGNDTDSEHRLVELATTVENMKRPRAIKEIIERIQTHISNDESDNLTEAGVPLSKEYEKLYGNNTSVRGFKVRGVYNTQDEAKARAEEIRNKDPNFHVFMGEVGKWLPFNPLNINEVDSEYYNKQLNDLIKENREARKVDAVEFEERKKSQMSVKDDTKRKVRMRDKVAILRKIRSKQREKLNIQKLKQKLKENANE